VVFKFYAKRSLRNANHYTDRRRIAVACDNTTPDSGLTDTCISIAHGALPQWWLSPAITLNGASAGATANPPPAVNVANVTFHRTGADSALPAGTSGVLIAVYACVPGLAMNPADASKVKQLGATGTVYVPLSQAAAGADTSLSGVGKAINWTASTDPTTPDGPGHKCLVAVAYPDSETPDPVCFHQAGGPGAADQHYAQLNIAIEPVPMHAKRPWMFRTFTINPDRAADAPARLRVEADVDPHPDVIKILLPALKAASGYKRVATRPPKSFVLQLPEFPKAVTRDPMRSSPPSRIMGLPEIKSGPNPSHEVDVKLHAGQIATINFTADFSSSTPGDAHIFHLTHTRSDGRVIGGLTLAAVVH
jgi:hypothetical protein